MDELQKLYDVLYSKGLYTKSFDDFKTKYSDTGNIDKLFQVVTDRGLYTKTKDDFVNKYFTSTKGEPAKVEKNGESESTLAGEPISSDFKKPKIYYGQTREEKTSPNRELSVKEKLMGNKIGVENDMNVGAASKKASMDYILEVSFRKKADEKVSNNLKNIAVITDDAVVKETDNNLKKLVTEDDYVKEKIIPRVNDKLLVKKKELQKQLLDGKLTEEKINLLEQDFNDYSQNIFDEEIANDPIFRKRLEKYAEVTGERIFEKYREDQRNKILPEWAKGNKLFESAYKSVAINMGSSLASSATMELDTQEKQIINEIEKLEGAINSGRLNPDKNYYYTDNITKPLTADEYLQSLKIQKDNIRKEKYKTLSHAISLQEQSQFFDNVELFDGEGITFDDIVRTTGEQIPNTISALLTFGVSTAMTESGDTYLNDIKEVAKKKFNTTSPTIDQLINIMDNGEDSKALANIVGVINGLSERVGAGAQTDAMKKPILSLFKGEFKKILKSGTKDLGKAVLEEAGTESFQSLTQQLAESYVTGENRININDILESGAQGGFGALIFSGGGKILNQSVTETKSLINKVNMSNINDGLKAKLTENIQTQINQLEKDGNISKEQSDDLRQHIVDSEKNAKKVPKDIDLSDKPEVLDLLKEKEDLKEEMKNVDENFKPKIQEKIDKVDSKIQEKLNEKSIDESTDVKQESPSKTAMINVGMKKGQTNEDISEKEVIDALPEDVKVISSGVKSVESEGGTENTLSLELSRPLTDEEMTNYLEATSQEAIPQYVNGEGKIYGSDKWGDFNSDYFITPKGEILSNINNKNVSDKTIKGTGEGTQSFFGDVVSGKSDKFKPQKKYQYELSFSKAQENFRKTYDEMKGYFDEHIATSIPTFRDIQIKKGNAIVEMYAEQKDGALLYDLGGSEGGFVKTITKQSNGNIKTINLDPQSDMKDAHNKDNIEGSEFIDEAFGKGWTNDDGTVVNAHKPKNRADVVHESMMFQFIEDGGERKSKIQEVKNNYLKKDGVFITEEKFKGENYQENEKIKDEKHKSKYYSKEQLNTKAEEVLVGMNENQANFEQYIKDLKEVFAYVGTYWKAGNFKGIIATDNKAKYEQFFEKIGNTSNNYNYEQNNQKTISEGKETGRETEKGTGIIEDVSRNKDNERKISYSNSVRDIVSISDRDESAKQLKVKLKELTVDGTLTKSQTERLINKAAKLDITNNKEVDKFVKYFEKQMDKVVKREVLKNISSLKKQSKKLASRKSKNIPENVQKLAKDAININQKYLSEKEQQEYHDILNSIVASGKPVTSEWYSMVDVDNAYDKLSKLLQKAQESQRNELIKELGYDVEGLSNDELKKLIEADDVDDYLKTLPEDKYAEVRDALTTIAEFSKENLDEELDMSYFSKDEQKSIKTLMKADFDNMSLDDIRKFIKVVDNIIVNGNVSGMYDLESAITMKKNADEFHNLDKTIMNIKSGVFSDLKNFSLLFKTIFGDPKISAIFNRLSGLLNLSSAFRKINVIEKDIINRYDSLLKNLKNKNKDITSVRNTLFRGIVGQLIQGDTKEDLEINKSRIEQHIERLNNYKDKKIKSQQSVLNEIYNQLKDFTSQEQILNYVKSLNNGNYEIINFWLDEFSKYKEALEYNTYYVHNEKFGGFVTNYLPIKTKSHVLNSSIDNEYDKQFNNRPSFMRGGIFEPSPTGATITRTKTKNLPSGRILDLDFDSVMFDRMYKTLEDIYISKYKKDLANFMKNIVSDKTFAAETVELLNQKFNEMLDVYARTSTQRTETEKVLLNAEQAYRRIAVKMALGSFLQYPKQYISVAIRTLVRLDKDAGLMLESMFTDKSEYKILDMYSIGSRGDEEGGTKLRGDRLTKSAELSKYKTVTEMLSKTFSGIHDNMDKYIFYSLRKGDINVAKSSWIAYYKKYLKDSGYDLKDVDMKTEHEKISDDKIRQEAASYAEIMIEETQIESDQGRGSKFFSNKNLSSVFLRSILIPYQRFNILAKANIIIDLGNLREAKARGDKELAVRSAQSLASTIAEQVTFISLKIYLLSPLLSVGKDILYDMFGAEEPEKDDEKNKEFLNKKFVSSLVKDLNPLAIGTISEDLNIEAMNWLYYITEQDELSKKAYDYYEWTDLKSKTEEGLPFYKYKDKSGWDVSSNLGLYSAPFGKFSDILDDVKLATQEEPQIRNDYGTLQKYRFDKAQKDIMMVNMIVDMMSLLTGTEAETMRLLNSMREEQKREAKVKKKK